MRMEKHIATKIPKKIFNLVVPEPTPYDLKWAMNVTNKSSKKLDAILLDQTSQENIWRILYLLNIPRKSTVFKNYGVSNIGRRDAFKKAILENHINSVQAFAHKKVPTDARNICTAIQKGGSFDVIKFLIGTADHKKIARLFSNNIASRQALTCAVTSGDINMVKLIVEHGANLSLYPDILDLSKRLNKPDIHKYLNEKINEHNAQFEIEKQSTDFQDLLNERKRQQKTKKAKVINASPTPYWKKINNHIISEVNSMNDGQQSLTHIFNFKLQQMSSIYEHPPATPVMTIQNFKDIEGIENQIDDAFNALVKQGGYPNEYSPDFIKKPTQKHHLKIEG